MWLECGYNSSIGVRRARRLQRRGDFRGMVRVVVHDRHPRHIAETLKASLHCTELQQAVAHRVETYSKSEPGTDRGERVLHVVMSRYAQCHLAQWTTVIRHREGCRVTSRADGGGNESRVGRSEPVPNYLGARR